MPVSVFSANQANAKPQYIQDRTDLPQLGDYETVEDFNAAMKAFVEKQQETPMYQGDQVSTYTRPDGSTGEWFTAGISPGSPAFGLTEGQVNADQWNTKMNIHKNGPGIAVALQNFMNVNPEAARAMYEAVDINGNPALVTPLLAMMESFGMRPSANLTTPRIDAGVWEDPAAGSGGNSRVVGTDGNVYLKLPDGTYILDIGASDIRNGTGQAGPQAQPTPGAVAPPQYAPDGPQTGPPPGSPAGPPSTGGVDSQAQQGNRYNGVDDRAVPGSRQPQAESATPMSFGNVSPTSVPYLQPTSPVAQSEKQQQAVLNVLQKRGIPVEYMEDDGQTYDETVYPAWMQRVDRRRTANQPAPPHAPLSGLRY